MSSRRGFLQDCDRCGPLPPARSAARVFCDRSSVASSIRSRRCARASRASLRRRPRSCRRCRTPSRRGFWRSRDRPARTFAPIGRAENPEVQAADVDRRRAHSPVIGLDSPSSSCRIAYGQTTRRQRQPPHSLRGSEPQETAIWRPTSPRPVPAQPGDCRMKTPKTTSSLSDKTGGPAFW